MAETGQSERDPVGDPHAERTLGDLVAAANAELSQLLHLQIELAKAEIGRDVRQVATGSGLFVAAAFIAHLVLILASVTIALVLWQLANLEPWLSFLIVTGFYLLVAVFLVLMGMGMLRRLNGTPRTRGTLPRTLEVIRRKRPEPAEDSLKSAPQEPQIPS